jgi:hypothetical protein
MYVLSVTQNATLLMFTVFLLLEYQANMLSMWEFGMDGGRYDGKNN